MFISVFIDRHKIMEKKYDVNWSCNMFYYLSELEEEEEEEEENYNFNQLLASLF